MEKVKRIRVTELAHYQIQRASKEIGCTVEDLVSGLALSSFNAVCSKNSSKESKEDLLDWIAIAINE